jgi:hypothetical protein
MLYPNLEYNQDLGLSFSIQHLITVRLFGTVCHTFHCSKVLGILYPTFNYSEVLGIHYPTFEDNEVPCILDPTFDYSEVFIVLSIPPLNTMRFLAWQSLSKFD